MLPCVLNPDRYHLQCKPLLPVPAPKPSSDSLLLLVFLVAYLLLHQPGHRCEGYGLAWSHLCEGTLLSGSDDGLICTWDISSTPLNDNSNRVRQPDPGRAGQGRA